MGVPVLAGPFSGPDEYTADKYAQVYRDVPGSHKMTNKLPYPISDGMRRTFRSESLCTYTAAHPYLLLTASHCADDAQSGSIGLMSAISEQVRGKSLGSKAHLDEATTNPYQNTASYPYRFDYSSRTRVQSNLASDFTFLKASSSQRLADRDVASLSFMQLDTTTPPTDLVGERIFAPWHNGFRHSTSPITIAMNRPGLYWNGVHYTAPTLNLTGTGFWPSMSGTPVMRRSGDRDNRWEIVGVLAHGSPSSAWGGFLWYARDDMRAAFADANEMELNYRRGGATELDTSQESYTKLQQAVDQDNVRKVIELIDDGVDTTRDDGEILERAMKQYIAAKAGYDAASEPTEMQKGLVTTRLEIIKQLTLSGIDISKVTIADDEVSGVSVPK